MTAQEMAALFDVDLDQSFSDSESSDYTSLEKTNNNIPFEKKIEDMKSIIPDEFKQPEINIKQVIKEASNKSIEKTVEKQKIDISSPKVNMKEIEDESEELLESEFDSVDVEDQVSQDIKKYEEELEEAANVNSTVQKTETVSASNNEDKINLVKPSKIAENVSKNTSSYTEDVDLGLSGKDLEDYKTITSKFPQFSLNCESKVFKDFYKSKFQVLKYLLMKYPILKNDELSQEIRDVKLGLTADSDTANPEIINSRLDLSHKMRVRVSHVLMSVYEQIFSWERHLEILRAKLWKDHDLKGAHRRDGLILEHLMDMERYYSELEGIQHLAQHADNILKAASESLSRQLSCMNIKNEIGGNLMHKNQNIPTKNSEISNKKVEARQEVSKIVDSFNINTEDELSNI